MNFKLITLYKKNTLGKIEQWSVEVKKVKTHFGTYQVTQTYGELNGKQIQKSFIVMNGKNIGKKNFTSPEDQAKKEAKAKWEKKLKQGYVKSVKEAEEGKTDSIIKGGISPMLAHNYDDHKDKMKYPVFIQPKLDGQRCVAIFDGKNVTLWTRSRKQILSCPHIVKQLEAMLKLYNGKIKILDGELYAHKWSDKFETLMSAVRKNKPTKESEDIEFHIYDIAEEGAPFRIRHLLMKGLPDYFSHICFVQSYIVKNETELVYHHKSFVKEGFEGLMIREPDGMYENKRSKNLLKFKTFLDAEYPIVKFEEGKDNTVVAVLTNGQGYFRATMMGDKKKNQKYLKGKFAGKLLTVKFFSYTNANKVPRFPVGVRVRDEL